MVQRMARPPTEAATAMRTVRVVLLVFATPDKGAGAEVSCAASTERVRVTVLGTTVLTPVGEPVKLRVSEVSAAAVELADAEVETEEELDAVEEAEEEAESELVDNAEEAEEEPEVVADETEEVVLDDTVLDSVGIAPAPATGPISGKPRPWGRGERFLINRFMLRLAWSRWRIGRSWA